jgi:hypothetical protein
LPAAPSFLPGFAFLFADALGQVLFSGFPVPAFVNLGLDLALD